MDNDNKINELQEAQTHKEVQLFLKDELKNLSYSKAAQYNLEEEYARTKQHKNRSVVIILCVCAVVVSLLVAGLTLFITSQNRKIKVNIDTFNDLNLRALLNSAGRTESLYASALQAKEMLVSQRDDELNAADQKRENDLYVLRTVSKVSSKDAIARKTLQIQEEYKKSIKSIREKYEPEIQAADAKIAEIKEISVNEVLEITTKNAKKIFNKANPKLKEFICALNLFFSLSIVFSIIFIYPLFFIKF